MYSFAKGTKFVRFKEDENLCEVFFYSFPCDLCDYECKTMSILEKHLHTVHDSSEQHPVILAIIHLLLAFIILLTSHAAQPAIVKEE